MQPKGRASGCHLFSYFLLVFVEFACFGPFGVIFIRFYNGDLVNPFLTTHRSEPGLYFFFLFSPLLFPWTVYCFAFAFVFLGSILSPTLDPILGS